ncbi:GGDEF domain-containing protein [Roseateles violae]|uniref:diguanylate cyclase n=1 Tax=Roseateles violae TaxID=3058042 RepID=A0ABT8DRZ6_9BURK|nr:GGDEF domain-containing protein [Pelomonas sp. PFR6]MDN3919097.1 diguanylate cyclase [Pelomonas sp. PFR6]
MKRPATPASRWTAPLIALAPLSQGALLVALAGGWKAPVPALAALSLAATSLAAVLALRALRSARQQAAEARRTLEEAIDALPASVEIFDRHDRLVAYNQRLVEIYPHMRPLFERGASFEELARASLARGGIPDAVGREEEWLLERLASRKTEREPLLQRVHDERWLRIFERRTPSGGIVGVRLDVSDLVHEQQRLAASQAHLQALIRVAQNGVLTLDRSGHVLELNPACEQLFGFVADELRGSHIELLFGAGLNGPASGERLLPAALVGGPRELTARHRDGRELTLQLSVAEVRTETTDRFVAIITDLTERKLQEVRLREANALLARQSTTDGLTGVGNRRLFDQTLLQEWQRSARAGSSLALLLVDIDHFKQYNDHYGHVAGDDCLRRVASLLRSCVGRSGEPVCRYGGEEFAILLVDTDLAGAQVVAQRCLDSMRLAAIEHAGAPTRPTVSLSIGVVARCGDAQQPAQSLIEQADAALYQAKQQGRARMVCAAPRAA